MDATLLLALALFAVVSVGTPGPNNVMLLASGANFGLRRTWWHILGINAGLAMMIALTGLGMGALFQTVPEAALALKVLSVAYLLWLAWKIAHAGAPGEAAVKPRPMGTLAAAAFQWVNPKAWAMVLGAVANYAPTPGLAGVAVVMAVFLLVGPPLNALWTLMGREMRRLLTNPAQLRAFNWTMAAMLILSLLPVLRH
ncbi:LysE family translocator [Frigidibacter sp. SLM-1]|nr:LysE family translocator [Frigidibacter sp. ROC022]MCR8725212.1 LysE family translocator [Frigidibacter sp. ROC022]